MGRIQYKILALTVALSSAATAETDTFDQAAPGALPPGWICGVTGQGAPVWKVVADPSAPSGPQVLKQSGSGTYPWCVRDGVAIADGFVAVAFKPISGGSDQAGGVVWRWIDGDSYYVARANALEDNVSLYYTHNGRRSTIRYVDAPVARNQWHTLRAEFAGESIKVLLDGILYIDVADTRLSAAGAVSFPARSATQFHSGRSPDPFQWTQMRTRTKPLSRYWRPSLALRFIIWPDFCGWGLGCR